MERERIITAGIIVGLFGGLVGGPIASCCTYRHRWQYSLQTWVTLLLGSVSHIELERKFTLIHEHEWTGNTVTDICKKYSVSRKTYYKWINRYNNNGIGGLYDLPRVPHTMKHKIDKATEETILNLRLKRFGCNRI